MSVERGRTAEDLAVEYLARLGFSIIERNWRNRWCEIDVVARHGVTVHIVEVKYRRRSDYGLAVEFVTADKRARLERAAAAWVQTHHFSGPYQIDVIAIDGELNAADVTYLPNAITD